MSPSSYFITLSALTISSPALAAIGDPVAGLSPEQLSRFNAGRLVFEEVETASDGLGPVFNDRSCAACHTSSNGAVGGNTTRTETRFGTVVDGAFSPLAALGGSLIQNQGIGRGDATAGLPGLPACVLPFQFAGEVVPPEATVVAQRRTTPLFGLGFVDAVPDATFRALAQAEARSSPGTAGVPSLVTDPDTGATSVVGRFGWKSQNPTLHAFAGDAYLNEMGITNPSFSTESCPQGNCAELACNPEPTLNDDGTDVTFFTDFMTFLDAPPQVTLPPPDKEGAQAFTRVGCDNCHVANLQTGASPVAALANQTIHPYSDFLLHDMGSLGDGIEQNGATGSLMRTAPLWGLRFQATLLHDGRATTVTQAIDAHDGQGAAARAAFDALPAVQKQKLLAFLGSI